MSDPNDEYLYMFPPGLRRELEGVLQFHEGALITAVRRECRYIHVDILLKHPLAPRLDVSDIDRLEQIIDTYPPMHITLHNPTFHPVSLGTWPDEWSAP